MSKNTSKRCSQNVKLNAMTKQSTSEKKDLFADKPDISIDEFIGSMLENNIVPHRDGSIEILDRPKRQMVDCPCVKDAHDLVHGSMINIHGNQESSWENISDLIRQSINCNDEEKITEKNQYYKNECVDMLEEIIDNYGENAAELIGIPEYFRKTNRITNNIINNLYQTLMSIFGNNAMMGLENYRCILLTLLEKLIIQDMEDATMSVQAASASDGGVMGPYAHLDLPMMERVVPWNLVGEGLQGRENTIRDLPRYNPQVVGAYGVYGVFWEPRRWPYAFNDIYRNDGVYPTRATLRH